MHFSRTFGVLRESIRTVVEGLKTVGESALSIITRSCSLSLFVCLVSCSAMLNEFRELRH
jgi:hypothetical protein